MMSGKSVTFHKTVRGSLHILRNIPCEDCSASYSDESGRYHIAVVADGHGDPACMRSAYGAQAVVKVAADCLRTFAETSLAENSSETLDCLSTPRNIRQTLQQLTNTIISQWYQNIYLHLEETPLTEDELTCADRYAEEYRAGKRLAHVYGTTLIAALQLPDYLILVQQGDGRCVIFYADGEVGQPIPWDERCFENITTSMCDEDVAASIRHCVISLKEHPVIACYLGSDGVEDSYRDMEGTHNFYRKLSGELVHRNVSDFEQYLGEMLPVFSQEGSGDDVSVAGIVDTEVIASLIPCFESLSQQYDLLETKVLYDEKLCSMTRKHGILKKRWEAAKTDWELKTAELQQIQDHSIQLEYSTREALAAAQAAEQEFKEYDSKYQELLEKQQKLALQVDKLVNSDKKDVTEPADQNR